MNRYKRGFPGVDNFSIWVNYRKGRVGLQVKGLPPRLLPPEKARRFADALEDDFEGWDFADEFDDVFEIAETIRECADEAAKVDP